MPSAVILCKAVPDDNPPVNRLAKTILVIAFLPILLELLASYVHFQRSSEKGGMAIKWVADRLESRINPSNEVFPAKLNRSQIDQELCADNGLLLLKQFSKQYSDEFLKLVSDVEKSGAKLILLYLPLANHRDDHCRKFFQELANTNHVEWVDTTALLNSYPPEQAYFLPQDLHLSRLGHQLIAQALTSSLQKLQGFRSDAPRGRLDELLGGIRANVDEIRYVLPYRPFRLISNAQGFRMSGALDETSQRILALGDSFTFGSHLSNIDIYTSLLNEKLTRQILINAGIPGYGIIEERQLFERSAHHVGADLVVLQVSTNDLSDLFWFIRSAKFNKDGKAEPSPLELEFIERLSKEIVNSTH